jgi:hypothetical protein
MPTTDERLAIIETKQNDMAEDISFIKQKLSNGLVTDVAVLKVEVKEHKDGEKWLKRVIVGAVIGLFIAELVSAMI